MLEPFCAEGVAVVVSHHMNKPPPNGSEWALRYRASGSLDLAGGPDFVYALVRTGRRSVFFEPQKTRAYEEVEPFALELHEPEGPDGPIGFQWAGTKDEWKLEQGRTKQCIVATHRAILNSPNGNASSTAHLVTLLAEQGFPKRTVERALTYLAKEGRIQKAQKGEWAPCGGPVRVKLGG